jgi:peptidoglycan hydrolase-like protein with peptidoglycan-binding domain
MINLQTILKDKGYYSGNIDGIVGPLTLNATKQFITDLTSDRKWQQPVTEFVWLRLTKNFDNKFSDVCVRFNRTVADMIMPCSTKAGNFYVFNPLTVGGITGTAVATEQQVLNSHKFITSGTWSSLWLGAPYFLQAGAVEIYRDGNKNTTIDKNIKQKGHYGINFHRAGIGSIVDNWSAGCMVVPDSRWFEAIKIFKGNQLINFTLIEI